MTRTPLPHADAVAAWRAGDPAAAVEMMRSAIAEAEAAGAGHVGFDVEPAEPLHDELAAASGLTLEREVLQLRRPLPMEMQPPPLALRPFDPLRDSEDWLTLNNKAFEWHPDQGGWTLEDLRERTSEPWFDPAGFLLHEVDGAIAGFCWVKVHLDSDPPLGEIFVIGVDPGRQGRGLGRSLVLAGLDHLARSGLRTAMLHVEADNHAARALYDRLGFTVHSRRRWYAAATPDAVRTPGGPVVEGPGSAAASP